MGQEPIVEDVSPHKPDPRDEEEDGGHPDIPRTTEIEKHCGDAAGVGEGHQELFLRRREVRYRAEDGSEQKYKERSEADHRSPQNGRADDRVPDLDALFAHNDEREVVWQKRRDYCGNVGGIRPVVHTPAENCLLVVLGHNLV